jgi:toxin FitB
VKFLLDTNVVSEWVDPRPNAGVAGWLAEADEDRIFISAVTIAEIPYGTERMPKGTRRDRLEAWLTDDLPLRFEARVLPVDAGVDDRSGRVMARGQVTAMDAFIGAAAERPDLTLATRNVANFEVLGIRLINPWRDA